MEAKSGSYSTLFNLSARRVWLVNTLPRPLYPPAKRPGAHCAGGWLGPRAGLNGCGIFRSNRDSIAEPSGTRSESLYRSTRFARERSNFIQVSSPGVRFNVAVILELQRIKASWAGCWTAFSFVKIVLCLFLGTHIFNSPHVRCL